MKSKKKILFALLFLCAAGFLLNSVAAVWQFTLMTSAVHEITSSDPGVSGDLNIIEGWSGSLMNTDDSASSYKDKFLIANLQDPIDVIFNVDELVTDVDDLCLSYESDVEIWYEVSSDTGGYKGIIVDGDSFTLDTGNNYVWAVVNAKRFSCPQSISLDAVLSPA